MNTMIMPWGLIGMIMIFSGLTNALAPRVQWRRRSRSRLTTLRIRNRLADQDGELSQQAERIARAGGIIAAIAEAVMVVGSVVLR